MKNRNLAINAARPHPLRLLVVHIVALMALALGTGSAMATTGTWINAAAGDLTAAGSWSGGTPNGVGDIANITNTAMSTGNKTFNVNANITYGVLNLNTNRTSNFNSTNSGVLIFDNTGNTAAQLNTNNLGTGDQNYVINAAIQLNDSLNITNSAAAGNKSLTLFAISSTNGALTITNTSANHATTSSTRLNGIISDGSGSISLVNSAGFMEITAANTFTGTTTNTSGIIRLTNAFALQNSVLDTTGSVTGNGVAAGNGFKILTTSTLTIGGLSGSKNLSSLFNTLVDASNNGYVSVTGLTLNPNSGSVSYSGVIANGAANMTLTKTGAGTQILSNAANTYSGQTSINGGILSVGASGNLGNASATNTLSINGGTLQATESFDAGSNRSLTVGASGGTVEVASTKALTVSGAISGGGNTLNKTGAGELILSNASNTVGTTNVNAGKLTLNSGAQLTSTTVSVSSLGSALEVNGTLAGNLTTASGTILSGTGTIGTNTSSTANISGTHNPGNSPGIQNFLGNLSYTGGASVVNWELKGNTSTNAANPNAIFDQIIVGGNLDFTDPTVLNLSFTPTGSGVLWSDSFWNTSQSWTIYDVVGSPLNYSKLSLVTTDWLDSGSNLFNTARVGSSFSLDLTGQDVILKYAAGAAPEPSRAILMLIGAAGLLMRRRRNTKKLVLHGFEMAPKGSCINE